MPRLQPVMRANMYDVLRTVTVSLYTGRRFSVSNTHTVPSEPHVIAKLEASVD